MQGHKEALPVAPVAACKMHETVVNGVTLKDEYFWMRERDNPDVIAYIEAENAYTAERMDSYKTLEDSLYLEVLGRLSEEDQSVPYRKGPYEYYRRNLTGKQYPVYCRRAVQEDAKEELVLDCNVLAEGHEYFALGAYRVSPDHSKVLYVCDMNGAEEYTLYVKNIADGQLVEAPIEGVYQEIEWADDNHTLFYTTLDATRRPYRVWRHSLGSPVEQDVMILEEHDTAFFVSMHASRMGGSLFFIVRSKTSSEVYRLPVDTPQQQPELFEARRPDVLYYPAEHSSGYFILTNDNARNFRLMHCPHDRPGRAYWQEFLPMREDTTLEYISVFRDFLVVNERRNGLEHLEVYTPAGKHLRTIVQPEPVYALGVARNEEFDSSVFRYRYTSLVTPPSEYECCIADGSVCLLKQREIPGGYDAALYHCERIMAPAPDGALVPVSLVYRKDMRCPEGNPTYLYGYGSYGITFDPAFASGRISLLDRGFVYAIAHVRGSSIMGRGWYEDGKMLKKKNTFSDFIAAAEYMIEKGLTAAGKLVACGGSAGGLLMGVLANTRPDLFAAIIAQVPFVDVLNTMLDATLPLTVTEYEEWGNPQEPQYFAYIRSYSPYDNVCAQNYPHILILAGLNDPRVAYWEPLKWLARLRRLKTDNNDVLLKMKLDSGHGGASGRYNQVRETAFEYAFILSRPEFAALM